MRFTSPSRRAAGLLAVTTIGLSTAVLSVTGIASATATTTTTTAFSTDPAAVGVDADHAGISTLFTDGDCTISWDLLGAAGGEGFTGTVPTAGGLGGHYTATTHSTGSAAFLLHAGNQGESGDVDLKQPGAGGTNSAGGASEGAAGYTDLGTVVDPAPAAAGDDVYGGGGGAASVVETFEGAPYLGAFGGDGALSDGTDGVGGLQGTDENNSGATDGADQGASGTGDGVISGSMTCVVPVVDPGTGTTDPGTGEVVHVTGAPNAKWVSGVQNGLDFQLWTTTVADDNPVTGVEYSLDNGAWKSVDSKNSGGFQYEGTIAGLEVAHS